MFRRLMVGQLESLMVLLMVGHLESLMVLLMVLLMVRRMEENLVQWMVCHRRKDPM